MAVVEAQRVLGDHVQLAAKAAKGLTVDAVRVARGVNIRASLVNGAVDGEGGGVDGLDTLDYEPLLIDKDQVRDADLREVGR